MGKKEINKPEITVETFNRAIRTYQREDVSYLLAHGILKQVPKDEKLATYQQLVALQNMEILQAVAKEESHLNPQMFAKQSDSSQSKVFVNQCLMKFRKHFQYEDENFQKNIQKKCVHWQCHCLRTCSAYYCRICFFFWFRKE